MRGEKQFSGQYCQFVFCGDVFLDPFRQNFGEVVNFVLRQLHNVFVSVIQDPKTLTLRTRWRDVTRGLRDSKSQHVSESERCVKVDLGELLRTDSQKVVNVSCGFVVAAVTMTLTRTRDSRIISSGEGWDFRSVNPDDCPYDTLCAEGSRSIPEG